MNKFFITTISLLILTNFVAQAAELDPEQTYDFYEYKRTPDGQESVTHLGERLSRHWQQRVEEIPSEGKTLHLISAKSLAHAQEKIASGNFVFQKKGFALIVIGSHTRFHAPTYYVGTSNFADITDANSQDHWRKSLANPIDDEDIATSQEELSKLQEKARAK